MEETQKVESKPWDWKSQETGWKVVSDEFLPVAYRWKDRGYRRALDLGCGIGRHSLFLASQGFEVVAADLSANGLAQVDAEAKRQGLSNRISTLLSDLSAMPEDPGTFDCILAFHALYHTDYAGLKRALSWITRHLRSQGGLYVTFISMNNDSFSRATNRRIDEHTIVKTEGPEEGIPHTYLTLSDIVTLLEEYELSKLQEIRGFYEPGRISAHYFVEAYKKR